MPAVPSAPWAARSGRDKHSAFADLEVRGEIQRFRWCPAGSFDLIDEMGQLQITLTRGFWIGETTVTQAFWAAVMGFNPSEFRSAFSGAMPVEMVSWDDSVRFSNRVSSLAGLGQVYDDSGEEVSWDREAPGFRLPTEAEWHYAARAGEDLRFSGWTGADKVAWTFRNSHRRPHPVGLKAPNAWGMRDMSGNVWEWCWDRQDLGPYSDGDIDPIGMSDPRRYPDRVFRGGSWFNDFVLSALDEWRIRGGPPSYSSNRLGLRLAKMGP